MKNDLTFIVLVGPPGCGKTTWRNKNVPDSVVLSSDDIMLDMCETPEDYNDCWKNANWKEVRKKLNKIFDEAIAERKSIIADTTNMGSKRRKALLVRVPSEYNKIVVLFDWERKVLLERLNRPDNKIMTVETIDMFISQYQPIDKKEEGFDKMIRVK